MTVEKLRKAAEELAERKSRMVRTLPGTSESTDNIRNYAIKLATMHELLTPERVLALCKLARVMDDTHLIARQSPDWPGERFLNGTDEGTLALEALAAIEAAFGD